MPLHAQRLLLLPPARVGGAVRNDRFPGRFCALLLERLHARHAVRGGEHLREDDTAGVRVRCSRCEIRVAKAKCARLLLKLEGGQLARVDRVDVRVAREQLGGLDAVEGRQRAGAAALQHLQRARPLPLPQLVQVAHKLLVGLAEDAGEDNALH